LVSLPIGFSYTGTLYIKNSYPISGRDEYKVSGKRNILATHAVAHKSGLSCSKEKNT
jgi:hypothetical protein